MDLDALILSRLQFAFTIAFHIIFPSFTIGLASFLAVLEGLWLVTKNEAFKTLYLFWVKIFAISFGMGVVTGVVLSYQLGTNWSVFSTVASPVIGPLLAFEVLAAFFLEASFLGVMLFGWKKVGPGLHFTSTGEHAGQADRGENDGHRKRLIEEGGAQAQGFDVFQNPLTQADAGQVSAVSPHRMLGVSAAINVIEQKTRKFAACCLTVIRCG